MASHSHILGLLTIACFVSLISPAISKTCSTQNIGKTPFQTCIDLPVLDSYLHYTYNASNSSLSVAFVSTPSKPNNWVAWAINPTWDGMIGSQTFLAFRSGRGVVVKTYNISDYSSLVEGKLAFDFWNLRAESMKDGKIVIFTSVKVPAGADSVNQVWQIGGNVTNGLPGIHDTNEANMNSKAVLNLKSADAPSSAPASDPSSSPVSAPGGSAPPGQTEGSKSAGSIMTSAKFGVNLGIFVLLGSIFIF